MLQSLSLNGLWKLRWFDGRGGMPQLAEADFYEPTGYIDATVPGEIHLDAIKAGLIAEPTVGTNVLAARWVEECLWTYRKEFAAPAAALKARAWLMFEGLDYGARIVLNGAEVAAHANSFYPCRVEVTGKLKAGRNRLVVYLESGLHSVADKSTEGYYQATGGRLAKRNWLRKVQSSFMWDWAPRLINVGIHGSVRLEWTAVSVRADQFVPLVTVSDDLKTGLVTGRWFVEGLSRRPIKGELELCVLEADVKTVQAVTIQPGLHPVEAQAEVSSPRLWWPIGHGDPERYTLQATLRVAGKTVAQKSAKVGFRHVRINQEKHPETGRYFIVEINHRPIFCKGGNLVPADIIFARIDAARYDALVDRAIESNFNFLRVWGGGLYEAEAFYDRCDERGILVWQEFIFACDRYPNTDQAWHDSVVREATYQVRRLARHPSLIVWCGNNEMEEGVWFWGFDKGVVHPDYALFHHTLPRILQAEDPTRCYQPSSPYSPDGQEPAADDVGDQHPWTVGFWETDVRKYRAMICRFPNEGGIMGPTSLPTMRACLKKGQEFPHSFSWRVHDNSIAAKREPPEADLQLERWTGKKVKELSIAEYVYWMGLGQGEGLKEYIDNFHRRMFSSSSAIFWMFNDTWPCTRSWTTVDYYLNRTPAHWPVKRAMAPLNLVLAEEAGAVVVYGINEGRDVVSGQLRYGLFGLDGRYPLDRQLAVSLPANASTRLATFPRRQWKDVRSSLVFGQLTRDGQLLARNRLVLPLWKDLTWSKPRLRVRMARGKAIFESPVFVWGVCLDLDGRRKLADNFFDVWPGIPYEIPWRGAKPEVLHVGNLV